MNTVDWNTLFNVLAIAAFVFVMMRGCGGGMCGMGSRRPNGEHSHHKPHDKGAASAA
jgi:hypothetical protein